MRGHVFISHSKEDRTVANAAVAMLEGRGTLVSATDDAGAFEASNQFLGDRSVTMTGPLGTTVWSRR
jgi:hypothetical protein